MEALFISMGVVALAEIGDKTQLLAFILAARFKEPLPIILGIFLATLINHSIAGGLGAWLSAIIPQLILQRIVAFSFICIGTWALFPDRLHPTHSNKKPLHSIFITTLATFFLAEIGDKTQLATIALAAHYATPMLVIIGTTCGMLLADIPAVLIGHSIANEASMRVIRIAAAVSFIVMGVVTLLY